MIAIHYMDGQTANVPGDAWAVEGPVIRIGNFTAPLVQVRGWEVLKPIADAPTAIDSIRDDQHV